MEKRTLLAIVLTAVVWIVWFFVAKPLPLVRPPEQDKKIAIEKKEDVQEEKKIVKEEKSPLVAVNIRRKNSKLNQDEIAFDVKKFKIKFTNKGAAISEFISKEKNISATVKKNFKKAKKNFDFAIHFGEKDFLNGNPLDTQLWDYNKTENSINFFTDINYNGAMLRIEKNYSFNQKGDSFKLEYKIINQGRKDVSFDNDLIFSSGDMLGPDLDYENSYNILNGIYSLNGDFEKVSKGGGFMSNKVEITKTEDGSILWNGIMSRYFLVIMIPDGFSGKGVIFDNRDDYGFRTGIKVPIRSIKSREIVSKSFNIYVGEKDKDKLLAVSSAIKDAADVSKWIEPIRLFVIWALLQINGFVGNLGWSLVIFSILSKIVFMPLTIKSTDSMKKMQALAPQIKELKTKFKDKPELIQKETMKLYKENKVNPMGGCLPMLLQMPFFFALFSALTNSVDLWNAPFILWMQDLSMPDTVMMLGYGVNILPIIMTVSTILQQKLTTVESGSGQQQKMMMYMMPMVFIFIFWSMPSGLVLYWTLQNLFQVGHQLVVNKFGKKVKG